MNVLVTVLLTAGVVVCVLSAVALVLLPDPYDALHAVTPVTSLGVPLVVAGLAVHDATLHGVAKLVLVGVVLAGTGPAASIATARAARARDAAHGQEAAQS